MELQPRAVINANIDKGGYKRGKHSDKEANHPSINGQFEQIVLKNYPIKDIKFVNFLKIK